MPICRTCNNQFSIWVTIDGKRRNLRNRTKCLVCSPFGTKPTEKTTAALKMKRWYQAQRSLNGVDPITQRREANKAAIVRRLGGGCMVCHYNRSFRNLSFHHLADKEHHISTREFCHGPSRLIPEIMKCILVCHNCHGEIHDGLIDNVTVCSLNTKVRDTLASIVQSSWPEIRDVAQ